MKTNQDSIEHSAGKLCMSPTYERLFHLSQSMPCDVRKPDDMKSALATCTMQLIEALDNDRIHFDSDEDKALFYGLLTAAVDYVMDGNLKTAFKPVTSTH